MKFHYGEGDREVWNLYTNQKACLQATQLSQLQEDRGSQQQVGCLSMTGRPTTPQLRKQTLPIAWPIQRAQLVSCSSTTQGLVCRSVTCLEVDYTVLVTCAFWPQ